MVKEVLVLRILELTKDCQKNKFFFKKKGVVGGFTYTRDERTLSLQVSLVQG
jgi:hypothetical protein